MKRRRRWPNALKGLRFRGPLHLGPAPDPDRRRRELPPTASIEERIEDFTAWLVAGGFSPEAARSRAERIRAFHRETGMNFLAMTPEELFGFVAECDYRIAQLLAEDDPEESGQ